MGNFSSCTAGFDPVLSSSPLPHPPPPPAVARVLLIDGSMLKFRAPIKVIKLLLDYPNHLICPLDSLTPGLHSLSTLLPDEKLQLGRLYLLLPFKSHAQESCIKSKPAPYQKRDRSKSSSDLQEREERTSLLPCGDPDGGFARCANFYKKGDVRLHADNRLHSSSLVQGEHAHKKKAGKCSTEQQKNHADMVKSEVSFQDSTELRKTGGVGLQNCRRRCAAGSCGKFSAEKRRRNSNVNSKEGLYSSKPPCRAHGRSPLCDTPELQKAYRSLLLQRSGSWTPRLQPILERR